MTEEDAAGKAPQTNNGQTNRESSAPSVSEIVVTKPAASDGFSGAGDVNGDGRADVAVNTSHSHFKGSKDLSTGQMTGKRQHDPLTIKKEVDASSPAK